MKSELQVALEALQREMRRIELELQRLEKKMGQKIDSWEVKVEKR